MILLSLLFVGLIFAHVSGFLVEPDYASGWIPMRVSTTDSLSTKKFLHGLGEVPLLVDVQVKAIDGPNKGYIFQASGHQIRDDDEDEDYGGVVYIYNATNVIVATPKKANDRLGNSIYTGVSPYWVGPNSQTSGSVEVRVRCWKASSLPIPEYSLTNRNITAATGSASDSYVKVNHGLGGYPSLVVSRVNVRWEKENCTVYADSVGASGMVYAGNGYYQTNGYVVVGYDAFNIQVWTPSDAAGRLLGLGDGLGIILEAKSGSLELYAWSQSRLPATSGDTKELNASQAGADKELSFTAAGLEDRMFTRALIQSDSAPNVGYRFPGNGYLAYETTNYSQPCTYGGLVYAYTNESARVWQPAYATGALICLASCLGNGTNSQASNEGTVVLQSWELDTDECRASPCQHGVRCVNRFRGYSCECESGYEGQNCDVNVDDCVNHACQNGATCSDLVNEYNCSCAPGFEGDKCQTATATSPLTSTGTTAVTPTHGGWSDWQEWQLCSVTCGTGVRRRYRLCNNPPSVDGSSRCAGASYEEAACNSGTTCPAAPAEATWGPWSATSSCSVTCGYGTQLRTRECIESSGSTCTGVNEQSTPCVMSACPIDIAYGTSYVHNCPNNFFTCERGSITCIEEQFVCDCARDCSDGSDENKPWAGCDAMCNSATNIRSSVVWFTSIAYLLIT